VPLGRLNDVAAVRAADTRARDPALITNIFDETADLPADVSAGQMPASQTYWRV
jgi:hypothetical protein